MSYADKTYYLDTYLGTSTSDVILNKALLRASEVIDALTHYQLVDDAVKDYVPFASQRTFVQSQIQKANCALAEHYIISGGYDAMKQGDGLMEGFIGDFKFTQKGTTVDDIPETVIALLSTTGLLYAGIHTARDDGMYYNGWWI